MGSRYLSKLGTHSQKKNSKTVRGRDEKNKKQNFPFQMKSSYCHKGLFPLWLFLLKSSTFISLFDIGAEEWFSTIPKLRLYHKSELMSDTVDISIVRIIFCNNILHFILPLHQGTTLNTGNLELVQEEHAILCSSNSLVSKGFYCSLLKLQHWPHRALPK